MYSPPLRGMVPPRMPQTMGLAQPTVSDGYQKGDEEVGFGVERRPTSMMYQIA